MRRFDWLLLVVLIAVAIGGKVADFGADVPRTENPRRPSPENFTPGIWDAETRDWLTEGPETARNEIPSAAPLPDEGVIEGGGERRSSTGSAFIVNDKGYWLTARHVAEGCDVTFILIGPKQGLKVQRVVLHPNADAALLITRGGPGALPLGATSVRRRADAYAIGFPKGRPGALHARYLGEMTIRHRGRNGYRERVNAWSERSRIPGRFGSLGGLSGGAVLDGDGRVIGIVQSESRRRGRIMTARPETLREVFNQAGVGAGVEAAAAGELTAEAYPTTARTLITSRRVALVICRVNRSS